MKLRRVVKKNKTCALRCNYRDYVLGCGLGFCTHCLVPMRVLPCGTPYRMLYTKSNRKWYEFGYRPGSFTIKALP